VTGLFASGNHRIINIGAGIPSSLMASSFWDEF